MAIKLKAIKVDIDLDLSDKGLGTIKPVVIPTAKEFMAWAKEADKKQKAMGKDAGADFDSIIEQLDHWYKQGKDFWEDNFNMPELLFIIEAVTSQVSEIQKK